MTDMEIEREIADRKAAGAPPNSQFVPNPLAGRLGNLCKRLNALETKLCRRVPSVLSGNER